jgi:RHS repeat-associated protein
MRYSCECLISRPDPDAFLGSGLKLEAEYDDGKRPTGFKYANAVTNKEIIGQTSTWNKVDLQTAMTRADASKLSKNFAYDSAYRLRNSVAAQDDTAYEIDGADNIRQVTETKKGVAQTVNHDVNNRNQVITLDGQTLTYDNNGNLVQMTGSGTTTSYIYDYKNQLVKVIGAGTQVEFVYDALGRRVQKKAVYSSSSDVTRYVYDGQQVIEERDGANALKARYAYGNSIDEPVQIERANTAGAMQSYLPMQDTNGNVIGIADGTGKLIEKVQYDAYGKPTFIYDQEPPQVDQVRVVDGKVRIRFSEAVNENTAKEAITLKEGTNELSGSFVFEEEGKLAVFAPGSALATNTQYALEITTGLEDVSGNKLANAFSQPFTYAGADLMVYDRVAPQVESVKLVDGKISVEFSEEIDPASAANAIGLTYVTGTINGTSSLEDAKTILFTPSSSLHNSTEYTLAVKPTVMDLSGKALSAYSVKFTYTGKDLLIYQKPDPSEHQESSIGNNTLFQGREFDPETGLYYFRARYLHPQLGRFLQGDPKGYGDSMNPYQAMGNNPVNFSDPMGQKITENDYRTLGGIYKNQGKTAAQKWIDNNSNFDSSEKLRFSMNLAFGKIPDPDEIEANRYKTNALTVIGDTINGTAYDIAGKTYCKLATGALKNDGKMIVSGLLDIVLQGAAGGLGAHYIPIGLEKLVNKFPVLNQDVGALVRQGLDSLTDAYSNSILAGESGHISLSSKKMLPRVSGSENEIVVIGASEDTAVAAKWPGHKVLKINNWTPPLNDNFIGDAISRKATFYLASPLNPKTLLNAKYLISVYNRELRMIFKAGYAKVGNYLIPPM